MSPIFLEYLLAVRRHWVALVTGSLPIAVYTVLVLGFPDVSGQPQHPWNHLPQWAVVALALLGVTAAQYLAWRNLWKRAATLRHELRERSTYNLHAAREVELNLLYGRNSVRRQADETFAFFEKLEAKVQAGDFSEADDLLIFSEIFARFLEQWHGTSTGLYGAWYSRLVKAVEAVRQHERETAKAEP